MIDNPKLPSEKLAAILVVDSYYLFMRHEPMLKQMLRALEPVVGSS